MPNTINLRIGGYNFVVRCIEIDGRGVLVGGKKLKQAIRTYGAYMGFVSYFVPDRLLTRASDEALCAHISGS